jgi:hypothetical protein
MDEKKINVQLLRKVKALILEEPRRLRMEAVASTWEEAVDGSQSDKQMPPYSETDRPPCGAVMCIGGHVNFIALLAQEPNALLSIDGDANEEALSELGSLWQAQQSLGLTSEQAERLFCFTSWGVGLYGWPEEFETAYRVAKTPLERAEITARRIDHFLKTNGAE